MADIGEKGLFREGLQFEEEVSVTLPAYVWLSFVASYGGAEWGNVYATTVANAAQKEMLSTRVVSEQEAAEEAAREQREAMKAHFLAQIPGLPGDPRREQ